MYVAASDAPAFIELQERFGLPAATSNMTELFGEYHAHTASGFWSFNPRNRLWKRHESGYRIDHFVESLSPKERSAYWTCTEGLGELASPELPADLSIFQRDKPFLYMGFKFQWLFIPELKRWELLPLGRYGPADQLD